MRGIAVLLCLGVAACTEINPNYCTNNNVCKQGEVCNLKTNACEADRREDMATPDLTDLTSPADMATPDLRSADMATPDLRNAPL